MKHYLVQEKNTASPYNKGLYSLSFFRKVYYISKVSKLLLNIEVFEDEEASIQYRDLVFRVYR